MVQAFLAFDSSGCLRRVRLTGHAGFSIKGSDVVCAAASVLVRTFVRTLEAHDGRVHGAVPSDPGDFRLDLPAGSRADAWLTGVTDSLVVGLADLAEEYPGFCALTIEQYSEE